ncbi:MAG: hypothetical protein FWC38_06530 [Proteobacteria bacterium]|nr:hypothetical protein [Pseudomonadota bacterium]MCL2307863.1 hypothetical protein [Pseudomonadota bacterium]
MTRLREKLERFANGLAVVLGAVSLAVAVAWWAWYALGPKPVHITPAPIESPTAVLRAAPLFGSAPMAPTGKSGDAALEGELRLLGLIAENEGQGYAVFRFGQGVYIAQAGDEVAGRATLIRIEPNAIILRESSGAERRVVLRPEEKSNEKSAENPAASMMSSAACVPANFKGGVVHLNTELLQGASMQPETFYALLEARDGGLVVRTDNGHAAMLGLRAGDVLQSANNIALTRAEDVSATILKPLTTGQSVLLKGKRGDQTRELLLVNASVCRG